jgi:hypothetical protein
MQTRLSPAHPESDRLSLPQIEERIRNRAYDLYLQHGCVHSLRTTWFKIRNREYSQMVGREEVFERERHQEPVAGWHSCSLACGEAES